jgi:DNA-binding NarL/FixJ family response regulator
MFESVARSYRERAAGVVLSGCGSDAALGSLAIAQAGGVVLAQDDRSSMFFNMPEAAVKTGAVERVLAPALIAEALCQWVKGSPNAPFACREAAQTARARTIKVLIADDHKIVLDGLRVLLESEPGLLVVASVEDGASAIQKAAELAPDVVVMDIRMPGVGGIEASRRILANAPDTRIVALSAESDIRSVDGMFKAGATGYLTKHRAFGELVEAIRAVMQGKVYLSREVARLAAGGYVSSPAQPSPPQAGRERIA